MLRIELRTDFDVERYPDSLIFAFWHEYILFLPFVAPRSRKIDILISTHRDGLLASRVIRYFGLGTVGGSSHRQPRKAFLEMLSRLRSGVDIGITPDGPKGPRRELKDGVVELAYLGGKGVVCLCMKASRCWRVGSWDRMAIPKPFSKVEFRMFAPVFVHNKGEFSQFRRTLKDRLNGCG